MTLQVLLVPLKRARAHAHTQRLRLPPLPAAAHWRPACGHASAPGRRTGPRARRRLASAHARSLSPQQTPPRISAGMLPHRTRPPWALRYCKIGPADRRPARPHQARALCCIYRAYAMQAAAQIAARAPLACRKNAQTQLAHRPEGEEHTPSKQASKQQAEAEAADPGGRGGVRGGVKPNPIPQSGRAGSRQQTNVVRRRDRQSERQDGQCVAD